MLKIDDVIMKVLADGMPQAVECTDEKNRNVQRTTGFRLRNKLEKDPRFKDSARALAITNFEDGDTPFIKVYMREELKVYSFGPNGELILNKKESTPVNKFTDSAMRQFGLMMKDNKSVTEISEAMMEVHNWTEKDTVSKLKAEGYEEKVETDSEQAHFPQDVVKREKLNLDDL
jgi:hypothetical protein